MYLAGREVSSKISILPSLVNRLGRAAYCWRRLPRGLPFRLRLSTPIRKYGDVLRYRIFGAAL
jgi:hypothetical protein